jgi:hypothetical protein
MAVQESQYLQLAEGFYANALKPMLDIGVGDVFPSNHCEPFLRCSRRAHQEMMIRGF